MTATTLSGVVEDGNPARVWRSDVDRVCAMERLWTNSMPLDKAAKEDSPCSAYLKARSLSGWKLEKPRMRRKNVEDLADTQRFEIGKMWGIPHLRVTASRSRPGS